MLEIQLGKLGLGKNEIKVYLALFELGKCKAKKIIDHTGLHRNLVYTALEDLVSRGLVSKVEKQNVLHFEANNPKALLELINLQKSIAEDAIEELKKKQNDQPKEIVVYEGDDGIKRSRNKTLSYPAGETLYVIGSKASSTPEMEIYWRKFHREREKKKINFKIMYERGVSSADMDWRNQLELSEAKYLPFQIDLPVWFAFISDYLEIGIPGSDPLTFSMRNKQVAGAFQKFFDFFWNQQVVVESGFDALEKIIYEMLNELNPGEEYCVLGASAGDQHKEIQKMYDKFHAERIKKGVITKMLVYHQSYEKIKKRFSACGDSNFKISKLRTFASAPPIPMQINIFNNKIFFIIYSDTPTILRFDRKEISDSFKSYFDEMWNQESYVLQGPEAVRDIWMEAIEAKELHLIGARGYFIDTYPKLYEETEKRAWKTPGIKWKNIVDAGVRGHKITKYPWAETKYLLSGPKNPNVIWLFGNKVAVINWAGKEPVLFLSTNTQLVQTYNDYFDGLWGGVR